VAKAYSQLYEVPQRIHSELFSLKKGVIRILKYFPNLINLLFGLRRGHYKQDDIEYELEFERESEIWKKVWDSITKDFYGYIRIPIGPPNIDFVEAQNQLAKAQAEVGKKL